MSGDTPMEAWTLGVTLAFGPFSHPAVGVHLLHSPISGDRP